jgi:hypothetical protein
MSKKAKKDTAKPAKEKLKICNAVLLGIPERMLAAGLGGFLQQPLPVLARLDLKMAADAILAHANHLSEAKLELLKKHGATEKNGFYSLKPDAPSFPEFSKEYELLGNRQFSLPLTEKVELPARLTYLGQQTDLCMDGVAAAVLGDIIDVKKVDADA